MSNRDNVAGQWTWEMALDGVIPPIITPLGAGDEIDTVALDKVVEHVFAGGCSGVFALGTTGEGAWLTAAQRRTVVRAAVAASRGRGPILVGLLQPGTALACEAARQAADDGADALVVGSPYYSSADADDQRRHVEAILAAVSLPVVLYNIPSCTHHPILPDTAATLAAEPRVMGIKDSAGDPDAFARFLSIKRRQPRFRALLGDGTLMVAERPLPADGLVPGPANIVPHLYVALHKARVAGDTTAWQSARTELLEIDRIVQLANPTRVIKAACGILGLGNGDPAPPHAPLDEARQRAIAAVVGRYHGLVVGAK